MAKKAYFVYDRQPVITEINMGEVETGKVLTGYVATFSAIRGVPHYSGNDKGKDLLICNGESKIVSIEKGLDFMRHNHDTIKVTPYYG